MKVETFLINKWSAFYNPFYFIRRGLYRAIKSYAGAMQGSVMDFGCGSKPYRTLFTACDEYVGVDVEISGHSHRNESIDIFYDGKKLPLPSARFDHVFSSEVFEHVFNLPEILPELHRVLKENGTLFITCPFVWPEHERPYDFARYTSFGIQHLLRSHGFEIVEQSKTGNLIEVLAQQIIYLIYLVLPKKPLPLYLLLHQIFILPIVGVTTLFNWLVPRKHWRMESYHNNIILARKA